MCNANHLGRYVTVKDYGLWKLTICEIEVYATGNCYDSGCYNVAKGKGVYISSLYTARWPANNAVDGNYWSTNINSGSCTHSNAQTNPWFRVDLWQEMIISKVYLANRGDCCGDQLTNVMIRIGNDDSNNGLKNPICRQGLRAVPQGGYVYYACPNMRGRQITLQIVKTNAVLNFCEIQVCGTLAPNLALGKPTVQSSTVWNGTPNLGVDGDPNPTYNIGTCTHTTSEKNPWWRVDLQDEYLVTSIHITNRGDCCESRLWGIEIRIGNSLAFEGNNNAKCISKMWNVPKGATHTVMCNAGYGVKGRYVNLLIPGDNKILTFCELMVFGTRDKQVGSLLDIGWFM
ncbi:uncharacterized protein LOC134197940 [Corticium candelabrum]|uniref:uncharacterized protein LOC134197940 n=1 Tax=Corticium candelabrum TaxID=121492 RepID=UPI002E2738B7|nr:uncharacterized protein LOC134197940 [Corticium candelabrum]